MRTLAWELTPEGHPAPRWLCSPGLVTNALSQHLPHMVIDRNIYQVLLMKTVHKHDFFVLHGKNLMGKKRRTTP